MTFQYAKITAAVIGRINNNFKTSKYILWLLK